MDVDKRAIELFLIEVKGTSYTESNYRTQIYA